jgi:hypothetical protein
LRLSGNKAEEKYCSWEAIYFYREAINVLNKMPDEEEGVRLILRSQLWKMTVNEKRPEILPAIA